MADQRDRRAHQLPALDDAPQLDERRGTGIGAAPGRCSQFVHAVPADVDERTQGAVIFAQGVIAVVVDEVVEHEGHRRQRRIELVGDRGRMRGEGDDAFVAGEALAQVRQFLLAAAQARGHAHEQVEQHGRRDDEVGGHAPQVQVEAAQAAVHVRQGLAQHDRNGVAGRAHQRDQAGRAHRQGQRGEGDRQQEQRGERIGDAAAPGDQPGQHGDVDADVREDFGDPRFAHSRRAPVRKHVERGQHSDAAPERARLEGQAEASGHDRHGQRLPGDGDPAQGHEGLEQGRGGAFHGG